MHSLLPHAGKGRDAENPLRKLPVFYSFITGWPTPGNPKMKDFKKKGGGLPEAFYQNEWLIQPTGRKAEIYTYLKVLSGDTTDLMRNC